MNRRDVMKQFSLAAAAAWLPGSVAAQAPASKPRLLTGLCAYSFRDELAKKTMTYDDLVRLASDLGIDGLELTAYWFPPNVSAEYLLSLRRLAYRNAIDIYGIGIRSTLCRGTAEAQDAEVGRLKPWLDVAERLGARHIRVFSGNVPRGTTDEQAASWVTETLKKCAAVSGPRGIILGLEDDGALTEKADLLVKMVKDVDSPWVGINLDVGNFKMNGYTQSATCLPYAVNVHLKSEIRENGTPQPLDWDRLFGMLAAAYRGYVTLEYEASGNPRAAVPEIIGKLLKAVQKHAPRA
jgi:L-ribulose-5-phosphate 3-epimerase